MKNVWKIFQRDMMRVRNNVIALVVIIGISVVPCLYAWFNIAASWDPYSNTGNLKVAVASADEGYEGSLIPIEINIGDKVLSALRENTQMEWVIPKVFSNKMMSVFSEKVEKPEITYYSNAKENAIAPKVTDKGAGAVQRQVNEVFIETVSDTTLTVLQAVSNMTQASGAETIVDNLNTNLNQIAGDMTASAGLLESFSDMTGSAQKLLSSTTEFLQTVQQQTKESRQTFQETSKTFSGLDDSMDAAADSVGTALKSAENVYDQMDQVISGAFSDESADAQQIASTLDTLAGQVGNVVTAYTSVRDSVAAVADKYPETSPLVDAIVVRMDTSIQQQKNLQSKLQDSAKGLRDATTDLGTARSELKDLAAKNRENMSGVSASYKSSVQKSLNQLSASLTSSKQEISSLLSQLDQSANGIYKLTDTADSDLSEIQKVLGDSGELLTEASDRIADTTAKLDEMETSGDFSELEALISGDKSAISTFLAAPVSLDTHKIYEIANYGSSMAPFYSVLSIWIGGIVLVAMLKVNVSENCTKGLKNVKLHQIYFGRFITFMIVGLFQSTLIALGDLLYLGIQCEHPFLFLLGCWFSSLVFVNIIYTLTVSLGDIGKAVSVILLVVQVAGTGGTFPIEVAPSFFRAVYPLLPFTHSMAALRETVGGMYGMNYWIDLGKLAIFLGISLIVGLVLRKPIIKANDAFTEKLEETKLM